MPNPPKYREVIDGRLITVAARRGGGYTYIEARVYAGPEMEGEPVADWEFPYTFRYDFPRRSPTRPRPDPQGDHRMTTPILSEQETADLREIERLLDEAYTHYFANSDGYCKSSEGHIALSFNNFFDRRDGEPLAIKYVEIYSYVLGPSRSHDFRSTADALTAVQKWHRRQMAEDYSDGGPFLPVEKMFTDTEG